VGSRLKVRNEFVVCSAFNPETGHKLFVEVTKLLLVEALFYDRTVQRVERDDPDTTTDEITAIPGWLTVVGTKVYRVSQIPVEDVSSNLPVFQVIVEWEDLSVKPQELH